MKKYDVAIIGGGTGGYECAIRCAQLGLKTVLVEKDKLGGTCLNIGCIPTKYFVHSAELAKKMRLARKQGIDAGEPQINIGKLMKNKDKVVTQLVTGVGYLLQQNGVEVIHGEAKFINSQKFEVNGEEIGFKNMILATGSSSAYPPVPGMDLPGIMTSTELLSIDHIPESLVIVGGGVIGCELACVFNEFGTKVTIVGRRDHLIPGIDLDVADSLAYCMMSEGVNVITGAAVTGVSMRNGKYVVSADTKDGKIEAEAAEIMISAGRRGNCDGFDKLGVEMTKSYVNIDEHMRTSVPNIYAIGDITGKIQLAHVASAQGIAAAENIAGGDSSVNYDCIPSCIYTIPEVATVGFTEEKASKAGIAYDTAKFPMAACGRAKTMNETDGFTKLIFEKESHKVIGGAIVGPHATEVIGEIGYIVSVGGTLESIKHTVHGHPTINETVIEAAHLGLGEPISIFPKK